MISAILQTAAVVMVGAGVGIELGIGYGIAAAGMLIYLELK